MTNGMMEATVEDHEQADGGSFFPNAHSESEYANAAYCFNKKKGYLPDSVDEAVCFGKSMDRRPKRGNLQ